MRRTTLCLMTAALVICALATAPAYATPAPANADCEANSRLTHHYTPEQLRQALATMPADLEAYTDCHDVIQRTLFAELGQLKGSGSGGSGGSFLPTPVLIVLIVLVLGSAGLATVALRRRAVGGGAN